MSLLIAALLLQAPAVEDHVAAFLKGDRAARAELLKLGAYAIRPLLKSREKSTAKVDDLLHELKKAASYPTPKDFVGELQGSMTLEGEHELSLHLLSSAGKIPFFLDTFDPEKLKSKKITLVNVTSSLDAARTVFAQTGLDYGYFHNHIVLGTPERLWPEGPPPAPAELPAAEQKRAKTLIEKLADKNPEKRRAARADLESLGPGVIPVLEAQLKRKETEIVSACSELLGRLRPKAGAFGPTSAARQDLDAAALALLRARAATTPDPRWHELLPLSRLPAVWKNLHSMKVDVRGHGDKAITIGYSGSRLDFWSLLAQAHDLDVAFADGGIVIDTPAEIEKLTRAAK